MTTAEIQVSADGHFFQTPSGEPFFLLADTAWLLFNKLREEEVRVYFEDRASKGFNAVQAVVFRDLFTPNSPNAYGVTPFESEADMRAVKMNPAWMEHVRRVVALAGEMGLHMGLLPTWGDKWNEHSNSAGPVIMDREKARAYAKYLSDALADHANVFWVLGGDSPVQTREYAATVHAFAEGIRAGGSADRLVTFHPCGGQASDVFHAADWLDFNAVQSGHARPNIADYARVEWMYRLNPPKPCMNMEPNYECSPMFIMGRVAEKPQYEAVFSDYDVRKCLYRSVLAGGAGFTYGCEPIRQCHREGDRVHVHGHYDMPTWRDSLRAPGSGQLSFLADLLRERSYFTRTPAQELFAPFTRFGDAGLDPAVPRNDDPVAHIRIARCREGSYIMAYCPVRQVIGLDTSGLKGERIRVSVYDPENCRLTSRHTCENTGAFRIVPQRDLDTFLVLDAEEGG